MSRLEKVIKKAKKFPSRNTLPRYFANAKYLKHYKWAKSSTRFPNNPGVYWFSRKGEKIYIGKAASLKKRISSYFKNRDKRVNMMVNEADNVSFKKTASVLEAIILEANAIKKYFPKYNIKEKDDRSFVYLVIPNGNFPKPFIARGREVEKYVPKGIIFGPYKSYRILKIVLNLARKIFPFSLCNANQDKSCFDYQIGLCPGICVGAISEKNYRENIRNLILFFKGEHKRLLKKLKKENPEKIFALQYVNDIALIKQSELRTCNSEPGNIARRIEGYDISHLSGSNPVGAMAVFTDGTPDKSQYRLFKIKNTKNKFDDLTMLSEILERRFKHHEWPNPDIILVDGGRNQAAVAKKITAKSNITIPIVGIAKILGHSSYASEGDKFVFENIKPSTKKLLIASRIIFQQVRNEAHRFAISFQRRRRKI